MEAKDNNHSVGSGMQQALRYAEMLDIPFVYSSNGDAFLEHDRTRNTPPIERELSLAQFPSPADLWARYKQAHQITPVVEEAIEQPYYTERGGKEPRYYQRIAINRTVEAIAKGQNRILLVMATGTGKTYTAFQTMWRLWKSGQAKRILFLADRNILVDQAMVNDFRHFNQVMTKVAKREVDKAFEVYLSLYQGLSGNEDWKNIYQEFSPDFFDLVVIDECHRGSAREDSAWREILEHFRSAVHIGLTATPKEDKTTSNIDYFGEPLYTYSLAQGIDDGFLAPYKVIRIHLDRDVAGYTPQVGETDRYGHELPHDHFTAREFDTKLVIDERSQRVAQRITEYLTKTNRFHKTIVFCEDIEHAERMRQALANENADLVSQDHRYVMRITGDDKEGKMELDNFINPEEKYPVITTTSRLMTTGIDAQTCHLIVLDRTINSMTEFKQIIGRGTRVREDFGKTYFTIMDFRNATRLFRDPDFDGDPVQDEEYGPGDPIDIIDPDTGGDAEREDDSSQESGPRKYYISAGPVDIAVEHEFRLDKDGRMVTESYTAFSRDSLRTIYQSLDNFVHKWQSVERKEAILAELIDNGIDVEQLQEEVGQNLDPFDLICHVAFDQQPLTRSQRVRNVKQRAPFHQHGEMARQVLETLLDKYAEEGIAIIEQAQDRNTANTVLQIPPFSQLGRPMELVRAFGGAEEFFSALRELEQQLYKSTL